MRTMYIPEGNAVTGFNGDEKNMALMDTVDGLAQKNSRMWQIIAIVSLAAFFLALGITLWAVNLPKTIPVIITVNDEGKANYLGKVDSSYYNKGQIPEIHKQNQINELISNMFIWYTDEEAQQLNITRATKLVQSGAVSQLDLFYRQQNPFQNLGKVIRSVEIQPPMKQTNDTYITYFTTTLKTVDGRIIAEEKYSILTTLGYYNMTVENPLGVYVTNFDLKLLSN